MTVLLCIIGFLFLYFSTGTILARVQRKTLIDLNYQLVERHNNEDGANYLEKDIPSGFQNVIYIMIFGWPIYLFVLQGQKIAQQSFEESDEETIQQELRYNRDRQIKARNAAERNLIALQKELDKMKSAEITIGPEKTGFNGKVNMQPEVSVPKDLTLQDESVGETDPKVSEECPCHYCILERNRRRAEERRWQEYHLTRWQSTLRNQLQNRWS